MLASLDTTTVIVPDETHNSLPENQNSQNIYISGDNLDALKHLLKSYAGHIKCIYIDPPYNTGSDGFVYNDKFNFTAEELSVKLSTTLEKAQHILDLTRRGSASHSAWLMFMLPRLLLARDLLSKDGVIFISIDDNEQSNLKLLCDDIFGEENFVALFPWRKRTAKSDVPFGVSQDYEWIMAYAHTDGFIAGIDGKGRKYYETEDFPGRPWRVHDLTTQRTASERPNSDFTIINPKNGKEYPVNTQAVWRITKEGFPQYLATNRIVFPGDYDFLKITKPVLRYWKEDDMKKAGDRFGLYAVSTHLPTDIGMSQDGTKDFNELFDAKVFNFPKPVSLIKYLIDGAVEKDKDSPVIILDFFSGSATTAQAVMEMNSADDGYNLQYILVQLPEKIEANTEAYNKGYKTIDEIGMERIRRAARKIKNDVFRANDDLGFKHYTLREPSSFAIEKMETFNPKALFADKTLFEEFGISTILTTWLVRDGYTLTPEVETLVLGGYKAYYIDKHLYLIEPELTNEAVAMLLDKYQTEASFNPQNVVIYGYSFGWNELQSLKDSLQTIQSGDKNLRINFETRY
ncbi:MAG: site-specific DNA-methyltransferase [Prevotellaceae bacterium]|nr:site-specific DNA-methyltransferase [Prevotellaceae bacterium]